MFLKKQKDDKEATTKPVLPEDNRNAGQAIYDTIENLPDSQEADDDTHRRFLSYLAIKLRSYTAYTPSWNDAVFTQFYEAKLTGKDTDTVIKEAKAYVYYLIASFSASLSPCLKYLQEGDTRCTYYEIKHILNDIADIEQALEFITRLSQFMEIQEAKNTVFDSIFRLYQSLYQAGFHQNLQQRLCHREIQHITHKYERRRLPLLTSDIPRLEKALRDFENAYRNAAANETQTGYQTLSASIRAKLVPIINEITGYTHVYSKDTLTEETIATIAHAIDAVTVKISSTTLNKRTQEEQFQLEIDLELLKQISNNL